MTDEPKTGLTGDADELEAARHFRRAAAALQKDTDHA